MSDEFKKIQAKSLGVLSHHRNRDPLQCSVRSLFIIIQQSNCEALGARCLCSIFGQRPAALVSRPFRYFKKYSTNTKTIRMQLFRQSMWTTDRESQNVSQKEQPLVSSRVIG